jgi:hypothetical protein
LPIGFAAYYKMGSNEPEIRGADKNNTTQHQHIQRERRERHKN